MRRRTGPRLTYANVMSTIAVLLALGGGGYAVAATSTPNNSVATEDVINGTLKAADIRAGVIGSGRIRDGEIRAVDIKPESLGGAQVAPDSLGGPDIAPDSLGGPDIDESTLGRVEDAETLRGVPPWEFVRGPGAVLGFARGLVAGQGENLSLLEAGDFRLRYKCPESSPLTTNGKLEIENTLDSTGTALDDLTIFSDNGGSNLNHAGELVGTGSKFEQDALAAGEHITLSVHRTSGSGNHYVYVVHVFSYHRPDVSTCHVQTQVVRSNVEGF